ncbi:DUF2007 domain-containing protein [Flavobacterium pedocola]
MNDFVTIAVFDYPHEITVLKHLLDQANISHYFENETIVDFAPMYSQALGGIKLKVHPDDVEAVKEIVKNLNDDSHLKIV